MSGWHTFRRRVGTLCRNHSGVSAVEVGITLLPFMLVMFGVMEFGWYFLQNHTMNTAVSEGIRIGTTGAVLSDPANPGSALSREASIRKAIIDEASSVMVIDPANITIFEIVDQVNWTDPTDPVVLAAGDGGAGAFMRVRVNHPHQFFTQFVGGFFGGGSGAVTMTSEGTYRNENFILGGPPIP